MKSKHAVFLIILFIAAVVVWKITRPAGKTETPSQVQATDTGGRQPSVRSDGASSARGSAAAPPSGSAAEGTTTDTATRPDGPPVTRAKRKETIVSPSGVRRTVIDPMASWQDLPPWPEGPRLFAEVETSSRRYINLRPDDIGELPRIMAGASERIELRVNFPEGEPGEKIYVELPNGGSFADTQAVGRVFDLPENRTLSFPYITDESRGHCNVKLRHRGHTRSLPVWVGALPDTEP